MPLGAVTIEIAGLEVTVPVKFAPGHVLTENQAKVLDAAYQRQFTNNQNASAKSRAEYKVDGKPAPKPALTAAEIAALYADYEPSVGGTPRQSMLEKLRSDAAWNYWVEQVTAHNEAVKNGDDPVIVKAGNKAVQLPSGKGAPEKREAMAAAILARANGTADMEPVQELAEGVQRHLDILLAQRGVKPTAASADTVVTSGADLI
jgi:hypothetical protein